MSQSSEIVQIPPMHLYLNGTFMMTQPKKKHFFTGWGAERYFERYRKKLNKAANQEQEHDKSFLAIFSKYEAAFFGFAAIDRKRLEKTLLRPNRILVIAGQEISYEDVMKLLDKTQEVFF